MQHLKGIDCRFLFSLSMCLTNGRLTENLRYQTEEIVYILSSPFYYYIFFSYTFNSAVSLLLKVVAQVTKNKINFLYVWLVDYKVKLMHKIYKYNKKNNKKSCILMVNKSQHPTNMENKTYFFHPSPKQQE